METKHFVLSDHQATKTKGLFLSIKLYRHMVLSTYNSKNPSEWHFFNYYIDNKFDTENI